MCDADQEGYIREALERAGSEPAHRAGLEAVVFYVHTTGLEDKLISVAATGAD